MWPARQTVQRGQEPVTGALKERVNSLPMTLRGKVQAVKSEANTKSGSGDGSDRSSVEVAVMAMERRVWTGSWNIN